MSKAESQFHSYHTRTGSDSTKGKANGYVQFLPPEAKELELDCQTMAEVRQNLIRANEALQKLLPETTDINEREFLRAKWAGVNGALTELNQKLKQANELRECILFSFVAKRMLTRKTIGIINREISKLRDGDLDEA